MDLLNNVVTPVLIFLGVPTLSSRIASLICILLEAHKVLCLVSLAFSITSTNFTKSLIFHLSQIIYIKLFLYLVEEKSKYIVLISKTGFGYLVVQTLFSEDPDYSLLVY